MESIPAQEWSTELAAELQRLSGLLHRESAGVALAAGERRRVAVLFLDLKDYTGLAERLDHETLHHLVRSLMGLLAREVEASGGYVDKFEGDMIMALFGAGGDSEVPCQRAVSCGLKMLERVASAASILNRRGIELSARVGVSYGPVTVAPDPSGHLTATGDEVNVASRLQSQAPDGGLLASAAVRRAAGDYFAWEDRGEKPVRGRTAPVHAFLAVGPGPLRVSWWREASRCASTPFVDRANEVSELLRIVEAGLTSGSLAVITGDPGSGKTSLVREVLSRLRGPSAGPVVVTGRSMAFDQNPYWLWAEVLRDLARPREPLEHLHDLAKGDSVIESRLEMATGLLRAVLGDRPVPAGQSPEDYDRLLSRVLLDSMRQTAGENGGLVLVLDDLQWLDSRSAAVLHQLLEDGPPEGVSVLAAGRERPDALPLEPDLRMRLEGLSESALVDLAENLLGRGSGLKPEGVRELTRRTIGAVGTYPLYFRDMILYLTESGTLEAFCGASGASMDSRLARIPGTLASLVSSRFDQLPPDHRRVLQYASVLGQEFPRGLLLEFLRSVAGEDTTGLPDDLDGALDALVAKKLLRLQRTPAGSIVSFRTPLARRVAYNTLLIHNRRILHGLAASTCLSLKGLSLMRPGMAARHLRKAGDKKAALKQGLAELKLAVEGYQSAEAVEWSEVLIQWSGEPETGARTETVLSVLDLRSRALELEGRMADCRRVLGKMQEMADSHGLPDWRARALIGLGTLTSVTGSPRDALRLLSGAAEIAGEIGDDRLLAQALGGMGECRFLVGQPEEAERDLRRALKAAELAEDPYVAARCLLGMAELELSSGRPGQAEEALLSLLSRQQDGNTRLTIAALANLGAARAAMGKTQLAEESLERAARQAEGIGDRRIQASCLCNLGALRRRSGDPERALESLNKARELAALMGDGHLEAEALMNIGTALADGGDCQGAFDRSLEALEVLRGLGGSRQLGLALRNAAVFAEKEGNGRLLQPLLSAAESVERLLPPAELARTLLVVARTARSGGLLLRTAELAERAEQAVGDDDGEMLAQVRALQSVCHLRGGNREDAREAYLEAVRLAGESPSCQDLRQDLEMLRCELAAKG